MVAKVSIRERRVGTGDMGGFVTRTMLAQGRASGLRDSLERFDQ